MKLALLGILGVVVLSCAYSLETANDETSSIVGVVTDQVQDDVNNVIRQKRGGVHGGYHVGFHGGYNVGEYSSYIMGCTVL